MSEEIVVRMDAETVLGILRGTYEPDLLTDSHVYALHLALLTYTRILWPETAMLGIEQVIMWYQGLIEQYVQEAGRFQPEMFMSLQIKLYDRLMKYDMVKRAQLICILRHCTFQEPNKQET